MGIFVQSPFHMAFWSRVKVQVSVGDGAHLAMFQAGPEALLVGGFLELRAGGVKVTVLAREDAVVQGEVLRAGLCEHVDTVFLGPV